MRTRNGLQSPTSKTTPHLPSNDAHTPYPSQRGPLLKIDNRNSHGILPPMPSQVPPSEKTFPINSARFKQTPRSSVSLRLPSRPINVRCPAPVKLLIGAGGTGGDISRLGGQSRLQPARFAPMPTDWHVFRERDSSTSAGSRHFFPFRSRFRYPSKKPTTLLS